MRLLPALVLGVPMLAQTLTPIQERADRFLKLTNAAYKDLTTVQQNAAWAASTDVKPEHDAAAEAAGKAYAAFCGNPVLIQEARELLAQKAQLSDLTVRQLERVLFNAADGPMTNPKLTAERIAAEVRLASAQNAFTFQVDGRAISANGIDEILDRSRDLAERRKVWEASKAAGPVLKEGLLKIRDLRNACAQELGHADFFALQAAKHGMSTEEMLKLHRDFLKVLQPLYVQLHTWAKHELAKRYGQPVPKTIPAHWLNNRWSQEWTGMVDGVDFDPFLKSWTPERVVKTAESFFQSIGMPKLPEDFWAKSDLYPVKEGDARKKNSHASCWHIDLDQDVRSLMSVTPNFQWFQTAHHELGHGYYQLAYSNPGVPPLLRDSATTAFHEAMAELVSLATRQVPYLKATGVLPADYKADEMKVLLAEALETAVPFMYWGSGTMTEWEAAFYAGKLPADQLNAKWWALVKEKQGVEPPSPRDEAFCDAATKTHVVDAPAYYFNYNIAFVLKYQFHDYICKHILKQDVHKANYAGHPEVGKYLMTWLSKGATQDWRKLLKEATGEELSTRALAEYFAPLQKWLEKQNKGRQLGWE